MEELLFGLRILADLALSAVLGFCIGLERKLRYKEAGIRTHTIVCIGSALMMAISKYGFGGEADSARVAAQIVSGVGFLGAGMIVYQRHEIHGLTTAAGVWATAGIGMACGARLYLVAVCATLLIIGVQCLLHLNVRLFQSKKYYSININFYKRDNANEKIKEIFGATRFNHLVMKRSGDEVIISATLFTDKEFSSQRLSEILDENKFIISVERCDNE